MSWIPVNIQEFNSFPSSKKSKIRYGPDPQLGFSYDIFHWDWSYISAVLTTIPIIAHYKYCIFGDFKFGKIVFGLHIQIWLIQQLIVYVYLLIQYLNGITRYADNPLNIVFIAVIWVFKHNNIPSGWRV